MTLITTKAAEVFDIVGIAGEQWQLPFKFNNNSEIYAFYVANGEPAVDLLYAADFNLTGAGNENGGVMTAINALPAGGKLFVHRWLVPNQPTPMPDAFKFPREFVEAVLDRVYMVVQQLLVGYAGYGDFDFHDLIGPYMARWAENPDGAWDAGRLFISEVKDPQLPLDAVNLNFLQAQIAAAGGNLPMPGLGQVNWVLATTAGASYELREPRRDGLVVNGGFRIDTKQNGVAYTSLTTPANNDGTYLVDRMIQLSDGNNIVTWQRNLTVVPTSGRASLCMDVVTANKKFGLGYILESRDAKAIAGSPSNLQVKVRRDGASLVTFRAALLTWTGGDDVPDKDPIANWNAVGINPTLKANWAYASDVAIVALSDQFQWVVMDNISAPANMVNAMILLWSDNTATTAGHKLYISELDVAAGYHAWPYQYRPIAVEKMAAFHYYEELPFREGFLDDSDPAGDSVIREFILNFAHKRVSNPTCTLANLAYTNTEDAAIVAMSASATGVTVQYETDGAGPDVFRRVSGTLKVDAEIGV